MDALTLLNRVQANPALYGFDHVTSVDSCSAAAGCLAGPLAGQNRYVFNDTIHTTSGFDQLMSNYIGNIINARDGLGAQGDLAESSGHGFAATLLDRLDATRRMNASFASYAMNARAQAYPIKAAPKTAQIQTDSPWSVFVQGGAAGVDRSNIVTSTGNIDAGINTNLAAVTAGIEYRVNPNLLAGGAFNYTNADTTLPGLSKTHVAFESFQGAAYA
jgi:outer membrane lipase/esterase